ncbi:MAG: hypothetical protein QOF46_1042, partial [Paraburkholderia sp.]|nr:hypothetical protein [Paraburkholderia sp.]
PPLNAIAMRALAESPDSAAPTASRTRRSAGVSAEGVTLLAREALKDERERARA